MDTDWTDPAMPPARIKCTVLFFTCTYVYTILYDIYRLLSFIIAIIVPHAAGI